MAALAIKAEDLDFDELARVTKKSTTTRGPADVGESPLPRQKSENFFHCCLYNLLVDSLTSPSRTSLVSTDQEKEEDIPEEEGEEEDEGAEEEEVARIGGEDSTVETEERTLAEEEEEASTMEEGDSFRGVGNPKQGEMGSPSATTTGFLAGPEPLVPASTARGTPSSTSLITLFLSLTERGRKAVPRPNLFISFAWILNLFTLCTFFAIFLGILITVTKTEN